MPSHKIFPTCTMPWKPIFFKSKIFYLRAKASQLAQELILCRLGASLSVFITGDVIEINVRFEIVSGRGSTMWDFFGDQKCMYILYSWPMRYITVLFFKLLGSAWWRTGRCCGHFVVVSGNIWQGAGGFTLPLKFSPGSQPTHHRLCLGEFSVSRWDDSTRRILQATHAGPMIWNE